MPLTIAPPRCRQFACQRSLLAKENRVSRDVSSLAGLGERVGGGELRGACLPARHGGNGRVPQLGSVSFGEGGATEPLESFEHSAIKPFHACTQTTPLTFPEQTSNLTSFPSAV